MRKSNKAICFLGALMLSGVLFAVPVFASAGVDTVLVNFLNLLFTIVRIVGVIMTLFGMVQVGLSIKSHDASQRSQGFLILAGGLIVVFAKEILSAIGVSV